MRFFSVSCSFKENSVNGSPLDFDTNCLFSNNWYFGPAYVLIWFVNVLSALVSILSMVFHVCLFASKFLQAKYISSKFWNIYICFYYNYDQILSLIGISSSSQEDVQDLIKRLRRSDFVLLYLISRNVSTKKFTQFLGDLHSELLTYESLV